MDTRHEDFSRPKQLQFFFLAESTLGAARVDDYKYRFIDQPQGWVGNTVKLDVPVVTNLRLDPFERLDFPNGTITGSQQYFNKIARGRQTSM